MPTFYYVYNSTFLVMFLFRHNDFYPVLNISYSSHISYSSTHIENTDVTLVRSHILKASSFASKLISENAISQLIINIILSMYYKITIRWTITCTACCEYCKEVMKHCDLECNTNCRDYILNSLQISMLHQSII